MYVYMCICVDMCVYTHTHTHMITQQKCIDPYAEPQHHAQRRWVVVVEGEASDSPIELGRWVGALGAAINDHVVVLMLGIEESDDLVNRVSVNIRTYIYIYIYIYMCTHTHTPVQLPLP
jgi:hypothetical protein